MSLIQSFSGAGGCKLPTFTAVSLLRGCIILVLCKISTLSLFKCLLSPAARPFPFFAFLAVLVVSLVPGSFPLSFCAYSHLHLPVSSLFKQLRNLQISPLQILPSSLYECSKHRHNHSSIDYRSTKTSPPSFRRADSRSSTRSFTIVSVLHAPLER